MTLENTVLYESMMQRSVAALGDLGVEDSRARELTRSAASQYHMHGRYRKDKGVTPQMHDVLRDIVKPYATLISESNTRRCELIKKENLTDSEKLELEQRQKLMDDYMAHVNSRPMLTLEDLEKLAK